MESAYSELLSNSVISINCIWLQACSRRTHAHPYTQTHTPQSMITHQGFRVESWALTYSCYICISLEFVVGRTPVCIPFPRTKTVARNPQTTCVQRCTDTCRRYFYPL